MATMERNPFQPTKKKYVKKISNLTNEESASGPSVHFNRNQGNNNFNSGFNNNLRTNNKAEIDILTEKAEEIIENGWTLLPNNR